MLSLTSPRRNADRLLGHHFRLHSCLAKWNVSTCLRTTSYLLLNFEKSIRAFGSQSFENVSGVFPVLDDSNNVVVLGARAWINFWLQIIGTVLLNWEKASNFDDSRRQYYIAKLFFFFLPKPYIDGRPCHHYLESLPPTPLSPLHTKFGRPLS